MVNGGGAVGIVLAAGAGTRFGGPKVLAAEGGWLHDVVHALSDGGCASVIVVLGAAVVDVPPPARAVVADDWADGMSASLRAGLAAAGEGGEQVAVLHLVDIPDVGADVVRRVLTAMRGAPCGLARAYYRGVPGHPVALSREHWPGLRESLSGDRGARDYLRDRDVTAVECGDLASGSDIDEPLG